MKKGKILFGIALLISVIFITTGCKEAKLKNGEEVAIEINGENITANNLYDELKEKYAENIIVNDIDKKIFNVIYKDDKEIEEQVKEQYDYYTSQYGDSFETTLQSYGYEDANAFKDELRLNIQRTTAINDYIKENISDKEIQKYYDTEVVGDISAKHILIKVKGETDTEGLSDEEALKKAKDIIKKLDKGEDFTKLAKENSDDTGSKTNGGDLGYFNKGQMVEEFEKAAFSLKVNEYTKTPVKTTYGYHIILKTGEKEKEKLDDAKDEIKQKIREERLSADPSLYYTALKEWRTANKLTFNDSALKKAYNDYMDDLIEKAKTSNTTSTSTTE